jgi:hypothetical protein
MSRKVNDFPQGPRPLTHKWQGYGDGAIGGRWRVGETAEPGNMDLPRFAVRALGLDKREIEASTLGPEPNKHGW